jgi:hypothetical protein
MLMTYRVCFYNSLNIICFFSLLSFGRQKKVTKKNRPKIQPAGFVVAQAYPAGATNPAGSHICLRRARSSRLSKELNPYSLGFGVACAPLKK